MLPELVATVTMAVHHHHYFTRLANGIGTNLFSTQFTFQTE
jgi:hypothetical protein